MLVVLSLFFIVVWLVFLKFKWLPFNRTWKIVIWTTALVLCLVVLGALQYYTPMSKVAVVEAPTQHIYPVVTGYVDRVQVSESDSVAVGDTLFRVDPRPFRYQVDNWTAALKLAEIALDDAKKLVSKGAIARFTLDQRHAECDKARAEPSVAEYNWDNTEVRAQVDGIVSLAMLRPGQRVSPKAVALSVMATQEAWITAEFKQNGLRRMAPGQAIPLTFISDPSVIYETAVIAIPPGVVQGQIEPEDAADPLQEVASAQDSYPVRIALPTDVPAEPARPGTLAQATVFTDEGNPISNRSRAWI